MHDPWLAYVQLLDSALPIGGFSHSFGLETLVQQEKIVTAAQLKQYIRTMLYQSWACSDAMAIKAVYVYAPDERWDDLWLVDQMLHVQRIAAETRNGVQKMGSRLFQLVKSIHPKMNFEPLEQALRQRKCHGTHALIHGWVSYRLGIGLDQAAEGFLYTCIVTCINSALRLMPIGQTQGQALLAELLPLTREAWKQAESLDPMELYANVPAAEIAMMQHETLYSRLFMS
jgi:urease accessory protein